MASTYVNDLRLAEMATGDASGSWGTVTNTNLELIGEAFGYGTETIGNADTTITVADGAADPARSFYLKIASSTDLTTTRTVTLAPNTVSKVWIIENATTGSQIITIKQGSGATINIPNGHVKMIASNGGGSGAIIYDLLTDLNVASNLFVKNAGTGDGSTANIYLQTAEADIAADDVIGKINFQAPNEGTGTDAILVAAAIQAKSEGDFSSSNNATSLNFMTGASEAATTKMTLSSGGNLDVTGDITGSTLNADGDTAAGDNAAIGYTAAEGLILTGQGSTSDITLKNDADAVVFTVPTGTDDILFPDGAKAMFGGGSDLQIYHDGNNGFIKDAGTGSLYLQADAGVYITNAAGSENKAIFTSDGAVTLYHNNAAKLATASGGVTVTGEMAATTMDLSSNAVIDGTALVTGVLTTTAATVFNGGFASNADSTVTKDDGTSSLIGARYSNSYRKVGFNANNSTGNSFIAFNSNSVSSSANQTYDITSEAARIDFASGIHIDVAASGSAGGAITYVDVADFTTTGTVFNEGSADIDFRVESNGSQKMLFVDGTNNGVLIDSANSDIRTYTTLDVTGQSNTEMMIHNDTDTAGQYAALLFKADSQNENPSTNERSRTKAGIFFVRDDPGTRGTGKLILAVDGGNDDTNVAVGDAKITIDAAEQSGKGVVVAAGAVTAGGTAGQPAKFYHQTSISLADDATLGIVNSTGGAMTVNIYAPASGQGATFFVTYTSTVQVINEQGDWAVADTDGNACLFSTAGAHAVTFKNRLGSTLSWYISIFAGNAN